MFIQMEEIMGTRKVRSYDSDFNKSAIKLTYEYGRFVSDVAENLNDVVEGISKNTLYIWRTRYKELCELTFPGEGIEAIAPEQKRVRELEKQLKDAKMESDILKKAVAIFSVASK